MAFPNLSFVKCMVFPKLRFVKRCAKSAYIVLTYQIHWICKFTKFNAKYCGVHRRVFFLGSLTIHMINKP